MSPHDHLADTVNLSAKITRIFQKRAQSAFDRFSKRSTTAFEAPGAMLTLAWACFVR